MKVDIIRDLDFICDKVGHNSNKWFTENEVITTDELIDVVADMMNEGYEVWFEYYGCLELHTFDGNDENIVCFNVNLSMAPLEKEFNKEFEKEFKKWHK